MRARARVRGTLGGVAAAAAAKGIDLAKLSPLIHAFTQRSAGSVYFRHEAMEGEVAAVHASGASIYQGAGLALIQAVPSLVHDIGANDAGTHLAWLGDTDFRPSNRDLLVSTAFLSLAHANATRRIGFRPHAAFGLSIGEHSALVAHGVEVKDIRSIVAPDICTVHLGGESRAVESYFSRIGVTGSRWANYFVLASVEELLPILATETAVWITVRISPTQLMVSGEASACREVVKRFGPLRAFPLPLTLALHCPVVRECEDIWKSCCLTFARESRVTEGRSATGVRCYSNALNASYHVTHQSFAEAYTAQAVATVDFPTTILQAWEDGVRIFVEHGPRSVCTGAITETLGDLPHAAVSLDQFGRSSVTQFADAVAQLIVAGVPLDLAALEETT
jgi:acyl transferase domain-containing protein